MELKDFIKEALLSIVNGVEEANKEKNRFKLNQHKHYGTGEEGQKAEFDLSVVVSKSSDKNGEAGIQVATLKIAGAAKKSESNRSEHRIKFEVFISEKDSVNPLSE